ncbi:MAG: hypothetical protein ACKOJF_03740, partial [Planctomycetaceae bacterium]
MHLLKRGNVEQPEAPARPGALQAVAGCAGELTLAGPDSDTARRAALAGWLTDRSNPLIWRTMANRLRRCAWGVAGLGWLGTAAALAGAWTIWARDVRDWPRRIEARLERELGLSRPLRHDPVYEQADKVYAVASVFPRQET